MSPFWKLPFEFSLFVLLAALLTVPACGWWSVAGALLALCGAPAVAGALAGPSRSSGASHRTGSCPTRRCRRR